MEKNRITNESQKATAFTEGVANYITPVLLPFGYSCTMIQFSDPMQYVEFSSRNCIVRIFYDSYSFEVGVSIVEKSKPDDWYTLEELVETSNDHHEQVQTNFQASSINAIEWCLKRIAELLARYGGTVLPGDAEAFNKMKALSEAQNEEYTRGVTAAPIREEADRAWKIRNYAKVVTLYLSIADDLTPLERKKLDYANSKLTDAKLN